MNRIDAHPDVETVLASAGGSRTGKLLKTAVTLAFMAGVAWFAWIWFAGDGGQTTQYVTEPVERGDLTVVVTASGSVEPTNLIEISSELSGTIETVNVDYNSEVTQGQILAELDKHTLQAQVQSARAQVSAAEAQVTDAQATLYEMEEEHKRKQALSERKVASLYDVQKAKADYDRAVAALAIARADLEVAKADLSQKEINLAKSSIISPIKGVVLSRNVDPGQTVAASLEAPTLFEIAEDLREMEVQVDVDEADVGELREGQKATFTVDAYPDRIFEATVGMVRYGSELNSNVVTYTTILATDNNDLLLRPGMTATADIVVREENDTLLVPNGALRYSPPAAQEEDSRSLISKLLPGPPVRRSTTPAETDGRQIWVLRNGIPEAIAVETGASDGSRTQIVSGDLEVGDQVIVDSETTTG